MGENQIWGLIGVIFLLLMTAFLGLYAWSLVKHHDNETERIVGMVLLATVAPAIVGFVVLIILGVVVALT